MTGIFLSYRTSDSAHAVKTIADRLAAHFGREQVFRDQDSLALGSLYPQRIRAAVRRADVVLAIIGPNWLDARDPLGRRRIDSGRDWVRFELRTALDLGIPVVPILLDGTPLPDKGDLPRDLGRLSVCTYWPVRGRTIESDLAGLIARLEAMLPGPPPPRRPAARGGDQQVNLATEGSTVYSVQGGNQIFGTERNGGGA